MNTLKTAATPPSARRSELAEHDRRERVEQAIARAALRLTTCLELCRPSLIELARADLAEASDTLRERAQ